MCSFEAIIPLGKKYGKRELDLQSVLFAFLIQYLWGWSYPSRLSFLYQSTRKKYEKITCDRTSSTHHRQWWVFLPLIQFSIPRWRPLRSSKAGKREARGKHDAGMETACGWSESCMPMLPARAEPNLTIFTTHKLFRPSQVVLYIYCWTQSLQIQSTRSKKHIFLEVISSSP